MNKNTYFNRHIREGMNNFKRNGWMTFTSVSSLSFMLFLVGVTFIFSLNLNHMTTKVEQNVEIHVYLKNIQPDALKTLRSKIESFQNVHSIKFVSKNDGLKSFMKTLGDEGAAFQTLKSDNPLNDELVIKTMHPQDVSTVAKKIEKLPYIDKVSYASNVVGPLIKSTKIARIIGFIFIICLTFIAVHTVTNTIKITVIARKEEIQLRKLIGANNYFIRFPFFIEGSFIGISGAIVACLLITVGYYFVYSYFRARINIPFMELISPIPLLPLACLLLLLFGIGIGIWGALSSLRRILRI